MNRPKVTARVDASGSEDGPHGGPYVRGSQDGPHGGHFERGAQEARPGRRNYARWRAVSLSLVYVVFAAHIAHWKITGKTLAPLELNEVMYTLELGIITAGFLFMCLLAFGTLIFGRFFCSWACHIMVLQDLCAWVLRKLRIRPVPVRSRVLLWVPALTAAYMFVWPQVVRAWESRAFPTFHFATDRQGWASFVTENFWRNLPSAPIIVLTFVVCGFVIVYLLGSRSFCTYVCPYGAIFALADRFSFGKIKLTGECQQCGTCTAACTSGVRVHEEIGRFGRVVNPACLKDLDCVSACPHEAIHYGVAGPGLWRGDAGVGRFGLPYSFSLREEVLMAAAFVFTALSMRGLYSRVPFLLSLACGAIVAVLGVTALRMFRGGQARFAGVELNAAGRPTAWGRAYLAGFAVLAVFLGHSAFVRYHEYTGLKGARRIAGAAAGMNVESGARRVAGHLLTADRWGLMHNERVEREVVRMGITARDWETVDQFARRLLVRYPFDAAVRVQLGQSLLERGRVDDAEREFRTVITQWQSDLERAPSAVASAFQAMGGLLAQRADFRAAAEQYAAALALRPNSGRIHAALGGVQAELGRLDEAAAHLREAARLDASVPGVHYNLGTILMQSGRGPEAIEAFRRAESSMGGDADLQNNLGLMLLQVGRLDEARVALEKALQVAPEHASAHFNLGRLLLEQGNVDAAARHLEIAADLDPQYAALLRSNGGS